MWIQLFTNQSLGTQNSISLTIKRGEKGKKGEELF
jgi:hypothetical protein